MQQERHLTAQGHEQLPIVSALGPLGTYTHQAAKQYFGSSVSYRLEDTISGVFETVDSGNSSVHGVCPLENSTNGPVQETQAALTSYRAEEVGRLTLEIGHALLRKKGSNNPVERIYSHEQGLGQCERYLKKHYPEAQLQAVNSTSLAAQMAAQDASCLAVSSLLCAEIYDLDILDKEIQDGEANRTTFIVFRKRVEA